MPSELGIRSFELIEQFAWTTKGCSLYTASFNGIMQCTDCIFTEKMRFSSCLCFRKISSQFCLCFRKVLPLFCLCFRKLSLSLQKETTI